MASSSARPPPPYISNQFSHPITSPREFANPNYPLPIPSSYLEPPHPGFITGALPSQPTMSTSASNLRNSNRSRVTNSTTAYAGKGVQKSRRGSKTQTSQSYRILQTMPKSNLSCATVGEKLENVHTAPHPGSSMTWSESLNDAIQALVHPQHVIAGNQPHVDSRVQMAQRELHTIAEQSALSSPGYNRDVAHAQQNRAILSPNAGIIRRSTLGDLSMC
eukprot:IDg4210t1